MNLHFTFSVREISEIADDEQTLRIPMYLSVEWEVASQLTTSSALQYTSDYSWPLSQFKSNPKLQNPIKILRPV